MPKSNGKLRNKLDKLCIPDDKKSGTTVKPTKTKVKVKCVNSRYCKIPVKTPKKECLFNQFLSSFKYLESLVLSVRNYTEIELNVLEKKISTKLNAIFFMQIIITGVLCYLLVR